MQTLNLTWKGETYEVKPSHDLFMRIEDKVVFNRIAEAIKQAGQGIVADVPMSHIAWVVYCCLMHAGVRVRNPIDVHQALFDGSMPDYGALLGGLIVAYYGSGPERVPKKKETRPKKRRRKA